MASTAEVFENVLSQPPASPHPIAYNYLIPNIRGLENLISILDRLKPDPAQSTTYPTPPSTPPPTQSDSDTTSTTSNPSLSPSQPNTIEISLFTAATEAFSRTNTNCSIAESLERSRPIIALAKTRALRVRGYISVALGCPYEGPDVDPHVVANMTASLLEMGCDEVSVADTTGMGTAPRTRELLATLKAAGIRSEDLALHFHDTYGQALVNTLVGLEHGVRVFDSSVGGLGGCPYSKGATGNVATEDLVHLLHSLGVQTGVDLEDMARIGEWVSGELGRANDSRAGKATMARLRDRDAES
jgi:hydroxymethylglutaryl-CoA lyase